jgi:inner membrane protein
MDSVTQILLGAAVGEAVLGRRVGRRALVWGGVCGLFPDLDVLVPLGDAVKDFTYHRGVSHSLFVLAVLTPLFVRLILLAHPQTAVHRIRWFALVYLAFATHVLLDALTVYGTQIFWPLPTPPVMGSTIFIIDPAYSVPLLAGVLAAFLFPRGATGRRVNAVCLGLSTLYLVWTVGAKLQVNETARASLARQGIPHERVLTVPSPFNTILWRVLAMDDTGYYEGFYSLLDDGDEGMHFRRYESRPELIKPVAGHWPVKRLQWFTHGFYDVSIEGDDVVITDLRMGMEPGYVFRFKVAEFEDGRIRPAETRRVPSRPRLEQLRWVWERIWRPVPVPDWAHRTQPSQIPWKTAGAEPPFNDDPLTHGCDDG